MQCVGRGALFGLALFPASAITEGPLIPHQQCVHEEAEFSMCHAQIVLRRTVGKPTLHHLLYYYYTRSPHMASYCSREAPVTGRLPQEEQAALMACAGSILSQEETKKPIRRPPGMLGAGKCHGARWKHCGHSATAVTPSPDADWYIRGKQVSWRPLETLRPLRHSSVAVTRRGLVHQGQAGVMAPAGTTAATPPQQ